MAEIDTIPELQPLVPELERRGDGPDRIQAIFHGNWLALLGRAAAANADSSRPIAATAQLGALAP